MCIASEIVNGDVGSFLTQYRKEYLQLRKSTEAIEAQEYIYEDEE